MRKSAFLLTVSALAIAGPAAAQDAVNAARGGAAGVEPSTPLLSAGELERHVQYLASDNLGGRRAGTPGAERAALYVVQAFKDAGLEPASGHPAYLQTFDFPVGMELGSENRLVLQRGSRPTTIFAPGRDFLPLAGSIADRVVEPVVFVGYGISVPSIGYDDYEGIDVRGKVVLVMRHSPQGDNPGSRFGRYLSERYKAATARDHGARAIVFVNGPATEEIDRLIPFSVDANPHDLGLVALSVTQAVARQIVALGGDDLSMLQFEINRSGAPRSRPIQNAVLNMRTDLSPRTRTTHNVIGTISGRNRALRDEVVVIGAHYDGLGIGGPGSLDAVPGEIHNGADDNASGVAALLELAQLFGYPTNRPDRTLVFVAFGAEEEGMLGSARFVEAPVVPLNDVVAMINLDMVGRLKDELIVYGVGSSAAWPALLGRVSTDVGLALTLMNEGYGPSDHAAFYLRQIPVLAMFTGVHGDYHRSSDDAELVDTEGLLRVTRLTRRVVAEIADMPARPVFDPIDFTPRDIAAPAPEPGTAPARLGAVPAPVGEGQPVVIETVLDGSAADRAGVLPGDRVEAIAGRRVETIYDYMRALDALSPDQAVRLRIVRDGQRMNLTVQP